MSDHAMQKMRIDAPVADIWAVLNDFERYPEWARELKEVTVLERDAEGRGVLVRFRAAAFGRSTTYTLRYEFDGAPTRLPWTLVTGDVMRVLDGTYELADAGDGATDVTYNLEVDLIVPLPGFVKRRAEARIISTALNELRARVTG